MKTKLCSTRSLLIYFLLSAAISFSQNYAWIKGSNGIGENPVYGIQGVPSSSNTPGARWADMSWKDNAGNFWVFGGFNGGTTWGILNDLWKYNLSTSEWTWMKGSNTVNQAPVFNTQGIPSASGTPGALLDAVTWTDLSGNLWLFGGQDGANELNVLWKYDILTNAWTWMNGSGAPNQPPVYGTIGVPSINTSPGGRTGSVGWTDNAGNLWLFGGGTSRSDLWKYTISTNQWAFVKGNTLPNQLASYVTVATFNAGNNPGGRIYASACKDPAGNFLLFGGVGYANSTLQGFLDDVWKYDITLNEWAWVSGSQSPNQSPGGGPGSKANAYTWCDASGNFWVFGGVNQNGRSDQLWKFNAAMTQWSWLKGGVSLNQPATYGTMGSFSTTNNPGGRSDGVFWEDNTGSFWLYGGSTAAGPSSDLWKFDPNCSVPSAPSDVTTTYPSFCGAGTAILKASGTGTINWYSSPTSTQSISSGSIFTSPFLTSGTTYYAEAFTCMSSASRLAITVTINPLPPVSVTGPSAVCVGNTAILTATGATNYLWGNGATTATILVSPATNTVYTVLGTYTTSCGNAASKNLLVNALPTVSAFATYSAVCKGNSTTLYGAGASNYSWTHGVINNIPFSPSITATYTVSGTDNNGCVNTASIIITANSLGLPIISIAASSTVVCFGDSLALQAIGAATYTWSGGVMNSVFFAPQQSGTYTVTGTGTNGCRNTKSIFLLVNPLPGILIASTDTSLCEGESVSLYGNGANTYVWSNDSTTASILITPMSNTTYTLTGTDHNGCINSASFTQSVSACTHIASKENTRSAFSIFPNPNSGRFTLTVDHGIQTFARVTVYNSMGKVIQVFRVEKNKTDLDLSSLTPGIYLLELQHQDLVTTKKLIID